MSPDKFIPLAEYTGLIHPIENWVLRTACRQGASWLARGFPASLLTLEITETTLMDDAEQATQLLIRLKALGICISLDDFGTGYSSLSYLKRFPLDELKIDKTFIDGLPDNSDDHAITSSIIDIASNLGLHTVAEGVETEAQRNVLIDMGCTQVQEELA